MDVDLMLYARGKRRVVRSMWQVKSTVLPTLPESGRAVASPKERIEK